MQVGCLLPNPNSMISLLSQMASHVHLVRALYSDSHEDIAVDCCFLELYKMGVLPK